MGGHGATYVEGIQHAQACIRCARFGRYRVEIRTAPDGRRDTAACSGSLGQVTERSRDHALRRLPIKKTRRKAGPNVALIAGGSNRRHNPSRIAKSAASNKPMSAAINRPQISIEPLRFPGASPSHRSNSRQCQRSARPRARAQATQWH